MFQPKTKICHGLSYEDFSSLMQRHLPTVDMYFFTQEGCHDYLVDVTDDIHEPEEWRKELLSKEDYLMGARSALSDYLSLLCYDKVIPSGEYIVSIYW